MSPQNLPRKSPVTMEELLAKSKRPFLTFSTGQKVKAKVVRKDKNALVLDIGGKTEGVVAEKAYVEARSFIDTLNVGDEVTAVVLLPESREGVTILSLRDAVHESSWDKLEDARKKNEAVAVFGLGANSSGITVSVEGLSGFIPGSQLGSEVSKNPQNLISKYFKAKIIEMDKLNKKIVLSEKEVSEEADIKLSKEALSKIKEGEVYGGIVTTVSSFGCFVKIEMPIGKTKTSVEGLVHISELSWSKVNTPADVVKVGDKVDVRVLGVKEGKLALSIKRAQKDPWEGVEKKYKTDVKTKGKVTRISDFGAFVELEPGVEGLVHLTKIPPGTRLEEGKEVNVYVEEIDTNSKKIALGLVLTSKPVGYK